MNHCDRCGALAQTRYILDEGDLLFCGHHTREYKDGLDDQGAILDIFFDVNDTELQMA